MLLLKGEEKREKRRRCCRCSTCCSVLWILLVELGVQNDIELSVTFVHCSCI